MTFRVFFRYAVAPLAIVALLVFAVFHRPIIRHWRVSGAFSDVANAVHHEKAEAAFQRIVALGPEAEPYLLDKAKSNSVKDRYFALYLLGNIHSAAAVPALLEALRDPSEAVRLGSVRGIKYMMRPDFVGPVSALALDPSADVRFEAADALGRVYSAESVRALYGMTEAELGHDQKVWYQAWMSLRFLLPVDGVVTDKFRVDKYFKRMAPDDPRSEVAFTYYFLQVRRDSPEKPQKEMVVNVHSETWNFAKTGARIRKEACSSKFVWDSPAKAPTAPEP